MYTAQAAKGTMICDYLKSIDYKEPGVSYRGNTFESCQSYRFGVSMYDRFIVPLLFKPFQSVRRIDYDNLTAKVSTAFVMIETGGMLPREKKMLTFDQMADMYQAEQDKLKQVQADAANPSPDTGTPAPLTTPTPRYYVYQFQIADGVDFDSKNLPSIPSEISEDRKPVIDQIVAFLKVHSGDEIFTPRLFPKVQGDDAAKSETTVNKE
jgi:hypothetical protein